MARRRLWRLVLIGGFALRWLAASPASSLACSCAAGAVEPDAVFVGRVRLVVEGEWVRRLLAQNRSFGSAIALLDVELMWQGARRPFYAVAGGTHEGDAGSTSCPAPRIWLLAFSGGLGRWRRIPVSARGR